MGADPDTLASARASLWWCVKEIALEPSWAAEYRIVRLDAAGDVAEIVEYHDASI